MLTVVIHVTQAFVDARLDIFQVRPKPELDL